MRKLQLRAGATALAVAILLSVAEPAFAARDDREVRGPLERVIRFIAKIRNGLTVGANDDGLSIPRP